MKKFKLLKDLPFCPIGTILEVDYVMCATLANFDWFLDWFELVDESSKTSIHLSSDESKNPFKNSDDTSERTKKGGEWLYNHLSMRHGPMISQLNREDRREAYVELSKAIEMADKLAFQAEKKFEKDKLRDQFAASAMQALVDGHLKIFENPTKEGDIYVPLLTNFAYTIAENMLVARSKYVEEK